MALGLEACRRSASYLEDRWQTFLFLIVLASDSSSMGVIKRSNYAVGCASNQRTRRPSGTSGEGFRFSTSDFDFELFVELPITESVVNQRD